MWISEPVLSLELSLREKREGRTDGCRYSVRKEKIRMKSNASIGPQKGLGPGIRGKRWTPTGLRPMDPDDDDDDTTARDAHVDVHLSAVLETGTTGRFQHGWLFAAS